MPSLSVAARGRGVGLTPFMCTLAWKNGHGAFEFRQVAVNFPRPELHPSGMRRAYFHQGFSGNSLVQAAACEIPATEHAASRVDRLFKVDRVRTRDSGIGIMGCVESDQGCTLDPVTVTACPGGGSYPDCFTLVDVDYAYNCMYDGTCNSNYSWNWGGGSGGGSPTGSPPSSYDEGPLAWAACVLAVVGSGIAFDQVADAFQSWWTAQKDYEAAQRMYNAVLVNSAQVSAETVQLWEFRVQYQRDRRDDALGSVREKVGASNVALLVAAASCGAAAFLPTP
jgi:hypothetical protein